MRRARSTIAVAAALLVFAAAPPAIGQDGGAPATTVPPETTVPPTTAPPGPPSSSTTSTSLLAPPPTLPPDVTLPPTPPGADDPLAGLDGEQVAELLEDLGDGAPDHYADQPAFDPGTLQVLAAPLGAARRRVRLAEGRLARAEVLLVDSRRTAEAVEARHRELLDRRAVLVAEAESAQATLRSRAVDAFLRGSDPGLAVLLSAPDAVEAGRRGELVDSVLAADHRRVLDAAAALDEATAEVRLLLDARLDARRRHRKAQIQTVRAQAEVGRATFELSVWQTGSHVMVEGFTFPVAEPTSFYDGWGDPRMPGTPWSHWHEGTDILAPAGSDLLAAEDGVISSRSSHILGGTSLWLDGRSGTRYYYAHLSGYAPEITEGTEVEAGEVIGYVGDTGNAKGTPHLHFEVHVAGGPVNPYPLLRVAWEWRVQLALPAGEAPPTVETGPIVGAPSAPLPRS